MAMSPVPIQCLYQGGTVLCVASGPSLTQEDIDHCRPHVDATIVVNASFRLAPWATVLYAADREWWRHPAYGDAVAFAGLKYSIGPLEGKGPSADAWRTF